MRLPRLLARRRRRIAWFAASLAKPAIGDGHIWSDGYGRQRCTRCYQPRGWDNWHCAGRPEPIVMDHGDTAGPAR